MDYSWLWHSGQQLADTKLCLVMSDTTAHASEEEPPAKRSKQDVAHQGDCVAALAVHSAVLATASEYWRTRLLGWNKQLVTAADSGTAPVAAQAASRCWVLEEKVNSHAAAEAAHLVLRYADTNTLPEPATAPVLVQMAIWADGWGMSSALSACLTAAAAIRDLPLPDLEQVLQYKLQDSITDSKEYKTLQQHLGQTLCQYVGPAQDVLVNTDKLQAFCSLSFQAVLLWAAQDKLQTDSEDTVAVLLTHWWEENTSSDDNKQQQEAAADKLTQVLRAGQLSRTFILCVLDQLPWFRCSKQVSSLLRMLHGTDLHKQHQHVKDKLLAGWMLPQRVSAEEEMAPFFWTVSKAQLDKLHNDAADRRATLYSPAFCWHGLLWEVCLRLNSRSSALLLGIHYRLALPEQYTSITPLVLFASFELGVRESTGPKYTSFDRTETNPFRKQIVCLTSGKFLGVPESQEPRAHSYPPDEFWEDGKLHLEAWMQTLK